MSDDNHQTTIAKLESLHNSTLKSADDRSFFSHLHRYLEFICSNSALEASAWHLFGETYLRDHEADNDIPDFEKLSNMGLKLEGLDKLFTKILDDYRGSSRFYYCWLFLYIFYYLKSVSPDTIETFGKNMPSAETAQSKLFSLKLRYELISASFPLDMSGNSFVKRSDFSLYLEVFHHDFIDLLRTPDKQTAQDVKFIGTAEIYYENYMTYISLPVDKEPFKLRKLDVKPNSGYDYFLTYMFNSKNEEKLITSKAVQALNIKCETYINVSEVLRHCGFSIALKRVFMPKRSDLDGFIYQKQAPVTQQQVDDIKKAVFKIVT